VTELIQTSAEIVGYLTVLVGALLAVWRFVLPLATHIKKWFAMPSRVDAIELLAYRGLAKTDYLIRDGQKAIYICTPDGHNIYVSDALAEMFDTTPEDMHGYGWTKQIISKDRANELDKWKACVANKAPYQTEYIIRVKGNIERLIKTQAVAVVSNEGSLLFYLGWCERSNEASEERLIKIQEQLAQQRK
jgi:PAS domain-containing protein